MRKLDTKPTIEGGSEVRSDDALSPLTTPIRDFLASSEKLTSGAEVDLGRVSNSTSLDSASPEELRVVEELLADRIFGPERTKGLIFTGGFGRFKIVSVSAAETYRAETIEEWTSTAECALRNGIREVAPIHQASLSNCRIISGIGNSHFADKIAAKLGLKAVALGSTIFANSEMKPVIPESIRGTDVFLVQRFPAPVSEYLIATQLILDALQRAAARSVTMVVPAMPYMRQDRRGPERTTVSPAVIAKMWKGKIDGLLTIDIHSPQIESLFDLGFHNFSGHALLLPHLKRHYKGQQIVAVSPDEGGVKRAEEDGLPSKLIATFGSDLIFAHMSKRRGGPNEIAQMSVLLENPEQLRGRVALVFDDMLDTGGTALKSAEVLKQRGVSAVVLVMTHAIASRAAIERCHIATCKLPGSGEEVRCVDRIFTTNSLPLTAAKGSLVEVAPVDELYANAILRICQRGGASLRELEERFSGVNGNTAQESSINEMLH